MKRYYVASLLALCQLTVLGITEEASKRQFEQFCFDTYELPLMQKRGELTGTSFINRQKRKRLEAEIKELEKQQVEAKCL